MKIALYLYLLAKRATDIAAACFGLVLLAPFFIIIAVAIRLDSHGPVLFAHERIGKDGKSFLMYKFRTMYAHAPKYSFKIDKERADNHVSRVGKVLRRSSLDELPQLLNILKGEMTLVGPRPEQPFIVEQYEPWQRRRFLVKPGVTGWWQVNGRSDRPMHENTDLDLYYVDHQSLALDLEILLRTLPAVFRGNGAY